MEDNIPMPGGAFRVPSLPTRVYVFYVWLKVFSLENTFPGRVVAPPLAIQVDGFPEFEVQSILDSRFRRKNLQYFVDWVGYDISERSWEPAYNLSNATSAIATFHSSFPSKPRHLV